MSFAELNRGVFKKFISWAKNQKFRGKVISNHTVNKLFIPLRMVCEDVALEYSWESFYPFFGFKKLPENDSIDKINPFTPDEQSKIIDSMSDHWKPFFRFAFSSGLRQGEQIAIKEEDIDWSKGLLHVQRAITYDENGKIIEGLTKNKYSRRTIKLLPVMLEALKAQNEIFKLFREEYFFCSPQGKRIDPDNLRKRVWMPALKKAGIKFREMKQTRHSFATVALSCGENPLWIARVMGHRNTEMIIKVYSRYIENVCGSEDGSVFNKTMLSDPSEPEDQEK